MKLIAFILLSIFCVACNAQEPPKPDPTADALLTLKIQEAAKHAAEAMAELGKLLDEAESKSITVRFAEGEYVGNLSNFGILCQSKFLASARSSYRWKCSDYFDIALITKYQPPITLYKNPEILGK